MSGHFGQLPARARYCTLKKERISCGRKEVTNVTHHAAKSKEIFIHYSLTCAIAACAALLLAASPGCSKKSATPAAGSDATASNDASSPGASAPQKRDLEHPVVRIETTAGPIVAKLDAVRTPGTVRNFITYVDDKFYDDTLVHFVDPGKMIVAGGYAADGSPKPPRTQIRNEAHKGVKNVRGTIAMARDRSSIDSATSQFFINLADAPQRDYTGDTPEAYGYCVFGEVTEGLDVADRIAKAPTADRGGDLAQTPDPPVVIKSIRVVQ